MKKQYVVVLALIAAVLVPAAAQAQQTRVEFTPYFAWRHGNDINDVSGVSVNLDSGVAYGFMVDVNATPNLQIEFIYSYRRTAGLLTVPPGLPEAGPVGNFDIEGNVDYFQGGVLYQFDLANPKLKPFVVGTLGAANMRAPGCGHQHHEFLVGRRYRRQVHVLAPHRRAHGVSDLLDEHELRRSRRVVRLVGLLLQLPYHPAPLPVAVGRRFDLRLLTIGTTRRTP